MAPVLPVKLTQDNVKPTLKSRAISNARDTHWPMPPHIPKDIEMLLAKIAAVSVRRGDLANLAPKVLFSRVPRTKLLSILKYTAYVVLLFNAGSLPFAWHIRVYWPVVVAVLRGWAFRFKLIFASQKERTRALIAWAEKLSPVGANPFELNVVYRRWASIDDTDAFGMHLSNSSYAKALDSARVKAGVRCFPAWGRCGGHTALAATHFHFLREIAPLTRYEVRLSIASWDSKWMYIVARYVTRSGRRHSARRLPPSTSDGVVTTQNGSADVEHAVAAIVNPGTNGTGPTRNAPIVEPDGAILHCVAVGQICFKLGRITVPPAIVLASEGCTLKPCGDGDVGIDCTHSYSHANPPPNWVESQSLRVPPYGSMDKFRAFLHGGWRDVPEGERWWEDALGGSIEARRRANLEIVESLKVGLERARTVNGKE